MTSAYVDPGSLSVPAAVITGSAPPSIFEPVDARHLREFVLNHLGAHGSVDLVNIESTSDGRSASLGRDLRSAGYETIEVRSALRYF